MAPMIWKHKAYYEYWNSRWITQPYFFGSVVLLIGLDWFISLKPTRLWGPFANMVKLITCTLLPWLVFFALLIIVASYFTLTLFAEE